MAMEIKHLDPQHVMDVTCKAIDEISRLRAENAELKSKIAQLEDDVAFWKKNLDDEMASRRDEYEKEEKEIRKLKRALWLARAKQCGWAHLYFWYAYTNKPKSKRYMTAQAKCRAKAEEYK